MPSVSKSNHWQFMSRISASCVLNCCHCNEWMLNWVERQQNLMKCWNCGDEASRHSSVRVSEQCKRFIKTEVRIFKIFQEAGVLQPPKCRHNRKCPWNGDMRSSMDSQKDDRWIIPKRHIYKKINIHTNINEIYEAHPRRQRLRQLIPQGNRCRFY
jgi:hypothetical protein